MVRRAPDGKLSLFDLMSDLTKATNSAGGQMYKGLVEKGIIPSYERLALTGKPTPYVTDDEWAFVRSHLPCAAYLAKRFEPEDLYVMQYSNSSTTVKIGRSRNVEDRRRNLEKGHNFFYYVDGCLPIAWLLRACGA